MIKVIFAFLLAFCGFFFGIRAIRKMNGMEKWTLTKNISYAILCAVLTMLVLIGIVLIF